MMKTIAVVLTLMLLLTGCGGEQSPVFLKGQIRVADNASIPEGAKARVSLSEQGDDGGEKRIVAERTLHDLNSKPIAFELQVARNLLNLDDTYDLRAQIMGEDGEALWRLPKAQSIQPLEQQDTVGLELTPVAREAGTDFQNYRCEDGFQLSVAKNADRATLRLGNRRMELAAENGQRAYADEHGNTLAVTGSGIAVRVDDAEHKDCQLAKDLASDQAPPAAKQPAGNGTKAQDNASQQNEPEAGASSDDQANGAEKS
jgi:uncharacterized lipoprotein YbaY